MNPRVPMLTLVKSPAGNQLVEHGSADAAEAGTGGIDRNKKLSGPVVVHVVVLLGAELFSGVRPRLSYLNHCAARRRGNHSANAKRQVDCAVGEACSSAIGRIRRIVRRV